MKGLRPMLVGAGGAVLALVLLPLTGLLSFDATSRHWAPTDWFFHIAARQSVTLRSTGVEVPHDLTDPNRIRRGAGHYDMVCTTCHGSPEGPAALLAADLTPPPPPLMDQMSHWRPEARIFWTVKHGIKRTAMPAWSTQMRDDEVWDMVAFLLAMPEMDAAQYAEQAGTAAPTRCAQCHGEDGRGQGEAFPRLDIQSPSYLAGALRAFRNGQRQSGTMMTAAHGLTDDEIIDLADHYGKLATTNAAAESIGAQIARFGIPERDVPACEACHGTTARPDFPRLAGQRRDYVLNQLKLFAEHGTDRGGPFATIMAEAVRGLTQEDMEALADWYGEQP